DDLVARDVAEVLGEAPAMTEGVDDLPVTVAPEGVLQRGVDLGTGGERPFPETVDVVSLDRQGAVRPAERQRREHAPLRELVRDHDGRVAERELDLHEQSAGNRDPS